MTREEYLAKNNLAVKRPDLVSEWDFEKNGELRPDKITYRSNQKVWWKCEKGHSWQKSPDGRSDGKNCPYCSGHKVLAGFNDLATTCPTMAAEWDYEKNGELLPSTITAGSKKKIWWKCQTCGHSWCVSPNSRRNGLRTCPKCADKQRAISYRKSRLKLGINDLESQSPEVAAEWDYELNRDKNPSDYTVNSNEKVWWRCSRCGHQWQATIHNRVVRQSGCPKCMKHARTSFPEQAIVYYFQQVYPSLVNSYTELKSNSLMELDVFIPELNVGIEYDGIAWHRNHRSYKKDHEKYMLCKEKGITLIRVSEFIRESNDYDIIIIRDNLTDEGLSTIIKQLADRLHIANLDVDVERDRPQIMQQYLNYLGNKSIAHNYPSEVKYWDIEKNKGLKAEMVNATSNTSYWWKCELGHSYKAAPCNRLGTGDGCPYCSGHKVLAGFNDLQTKNPELATEWDYEKNVSLKPTEVTTGSMKKVWWKCDKGHEWQATVYSRSFGSSCPYCSGKRVWSGFNDLQTKNPSLAEEWNYEKNEPLKPSEITFSCNKKVWWRCRKGHEWQATVNSRSSGAGCPYCAGKRVLIGYNDLQSNNPVLAEEWNYDKNGELKPTDVSSSSGIKVWWICDKGHEWKATVHSRSKGHGCPYCANQKLCSGWNDLQTLYPDLAKEWNYEKNDKAPNEVVAGSQAKVWWKCEKGHEWQAQIYSRVHGRKCPYCSNKKLLVGYNDFATVYPEAVQEWDYEKNGTLTPDAISCGSMTKVWWKCPTCGHEFYTSPNSRRRKDGTLSKCYYCSLNSRRKTNRES